MDKKEKIELLIKIFENQQTLIANADSKANISLSVQTFIATTVLGATVIVGTFDIIEGLAKSQQLIYYLLFTLFIICSIVGLISCILVFNPRPPQEEKETNRKGITYFGHIADYKNSTNYLAALKNIQEDQIISEFSFQNYSLAHILCHKMKYVKRSTTFFLINILLGVALLIISILIK